MTGRQEVRRWGMSVVGGAAHTLPHSEALGLLRLLLPHSYWEGRGVLGWLLLVVSSELATGTGWSCLGQFSGGLTSRTARTVRPPAQLSSPLQPQPALPAKRRVPPSYGHCSGLLGTEHATRSGSQGYMLVLAKALVAAREPPIHAYFCA